MGCGVTSGGIGAWEPNSRVVHATAKTFEGPYAKQDVVVAPFAHEPNAVRSPDGDWVIYMTMRHPPGGAINCTLESLRSKPEGSDHARLPEPRHTYSAQSSLHYRYGRKQRYQLCERLNEFICMIVSGGLLRQHLSYSDTCKEPRWTVV
eukprot:COSAG02_NODE_2059_length_9974_cov_6.226532_9_plen_149_part_00